MLPLSGISGGLPNVDTTASSNAYAGPTSVTVNDSSRGGFSWTVFAVIAAAIAGAIYFLRK